MASGHIASVGAEKGSPHAAFEQVYELGALLGSGGFGEVRFGKHRTTGEHVAVKILTIPEGRRGVKVHKLVKQEVAILKKVSHENIMRLKEVYRLGATFYLITEYCPGGELLSELLEKLYNEDEAREVMWGLSQGVEYLHTNGIVHRDLKLENILLERKGDRTGVKIADFGLAAELSHGVLNSVSGSVLYVAPEILACRDDANAFYDERVDVWSLGVALYILLSGVAPFDDPDTDVMLDRIKSADFNFNHAAFSKVSDEVKDLICRMLTADPDERVGIRDVLLHPFMCAGHKGHVRGDTIRMAQQHGGGANYNNKFLAEMSSPEHRMGTRVP